MDNRYDVSLYEDRAESSYIFDIHLVGKVRVEVWADSWEKATDKVDVMADEITGELNHYYGDDLGADFECDSIQEY